MNSLQQGLFNEVFQVMKKLESPNRHGEESKAFQIGVPLLIGTGFLILAVPVGNSLSRDITSIGGYLLFVAFGLVMVISGVGELLNSTKFGRPEAWASNDTLRPGDTFQFQFKQPIRHRMVVQSMEIFLIFRETVKYYDGSESQISHIDRLVQKHKRPERTYNMGDTLFEECNFQIPTRHLGIRNHLMDERDATVKTGWIIKIRVDLSKHKTVWREYKLDVKDGLPSVIIDDVSRKNQTYFDLYTHKGRIRSINRMWEVEKVLAPHLDWSQQDHFTSLKPLLFAERLSEREAQDAKVKLEEFGVKVEIRPSPQ